MVVTDRGRPIILLLPYRESITPRNRGLDYYARLRRRMPNPLTPSRRRALDAADRGER